MDDFLARITQAILLYDPQVDQGALSANPGLIFLDLLAKAEDKSAREALKESMPQVKLWVGKMEGFCNV